MDFQLTSEEEMLRDSVARFVASDYDLTRRNDLLLDGSDHWLFFADHGWLGIGIPEEAGGYDTSLNGAMAIAEALGGGLALEPYLAAAVLAPQVVLAAAGAAASATILRPVVAGCSVIALANQEHGARGRNAVVATLAVEGADGYLIDGVKTVVLGGGRADAFLIAARTSGAPSDTSGISLFLVPRDSPGLSVRPYRMIDATAVADISLDNVHAPHSSLIGPIGGALPAIDSGTDIAIVAANFALVGAMSEALRLSVEHLKTRKQFGGPLRDFQVLRHRAADMLVALEQGRSAAYRGLAGLGNPDPSARARAVSAAKIVVAECSRLVCGQAVQLHGGIGVSEEYRISHLFKYMAVTSALFGSEDYHVERLGSLM